LRETLRAVQELIWALEDLGAPLPLREAVADLKKDLEAGEKAEEEPGNKAIILGGQISDFARESLGENGGFNYSLGYWVSFCTLEVINGNPNKEFLEEGVDFYKYFKEHGESLGLEAARVKVIKKALAGILTIISESEELSSEDQKSIGEALDTIAVNYS